MHRIPKYSRHKKTGQAYVRVDGKYMYLSKHGLPESHEAYRRVVNQHMEAKIRKKPIPSPSVFANLLCIKPLAKAAPKPGRRLKFSRCRPIRLRPLCRSC
jgi:hypothetical protein